MTEFLTLPVDGGEGPYHFNRYRIGFYPNAGRGKTELATDFIINFPRYFNSEYANVVIDTQHNFHDAPLMKFHGFSNVMGFDIARFHHDWVVKFDVNPTAGFTVQTLERTFRLAEDAEMGVAGAAVGGAGGAGVGAKVGGGLGALVGGIGGAVIGSVPAYNANSKHFLAGRRSWRLDNASAFGVAGDWLILETAAVERFSCEFYRLNDKLQGLEKKVPPIWNTMLTNFVRMNQLRLAQRTTPPGWVRGGSMFETDYLTKFIDGLAALKADRDYVGSMAAFPYILPPELR